MQKCSQGSDHIVQQGDDDPSYLQEDGDRYTFQRYNKRFLVWEHHMQWKTRMKNGSKREEGGKQRSLNAKLQNFAPRTPEKGFQN